MSETAPRIPLRIANAAAYAGMVAVNALAVTLPLNGRSTGELSDAYPNLFVPAGITFSIWGLIYLLLGVFVVFQLVSRRPYIDRIGWVFVLSSVANAAWIVAWHYELVLVSLLVMLCLLGSLVAIYLRLFIGRSTGSAAEKWLVHVSFSVYLGWITVATVANATALLVDAGWGRFGLSEAFWAVVAVGGATLITLAVLWKRGDLFHAGVVVWAFVGIVLKRSAAGDETSRTVLTAAAVGIGLVVAMGLLRGRRYLRY